jgi:hypothetical protein
MFLQEETIFEIKIYVTSINKNSKIFALNDEEIFIWVFRNWQIDPPFQHSL